MDSKLLKIIAVMALVSIVSAGCCSQTEAHKSKVKEMKPVEQSGNCHIHNDNASRGTTKHCHAHVNGKNHMHSYGHRRYANQSR